MKNHILFALILVLSMACTSHKRVLSEHLIEGSCESEFNQTKLSQGQILWSNIAETSGSGASYMITGLGYSTDFLITFTGGVIGGVALCSPLLAVEMLTPNTTNDLSSRGAAGSKCLGTIGPAVAKNISPKLGPTAKSGTAKWSCPNLDPIAEGLIKVSNCYQAKGETKLAQKQLERMEESNVFEKCLSSDMKSKMAEAISAIRKM
jgi:hypothetical protein